MTTAHDLEKRAGALEDKQSESAAESLDVQINRHLIISRERAEREGRNIVGVANTPGETEHVTVEP